MGAGKGTSVESLHKTIWNGWPLLHDLMLVLAIIMSCRHLPHRIKWRTNQPWDDLPAIVAFETVSLLVELGARATADDAANNQEPLLWCGETTACWLPAWPGFRPMPVRHCEAPPATEFAG